MTEAYLAADGLRFRYPGLTTAGETLAGLSFQIAPGEFAGLIGPNGSGKTTLLKCLSGLLRPQGGAVLLEGLSLAEWRPADLARRLGVVAQGEENGFDFSVREVVAMGRYPHRRRWQRENARDKAAVDRALQLTGLTGLAARPVTALSGGEGQRVALARALAQEPRLLLLDEVTAHLDLGYQAEVLSLLRTLQRETGLTIVAVLHDLNLAARCCERLFLMAEGRILAAGPPGEVLTAERLSAAYGVTVRVVPGPDGQPLVSVAAAGAPPPVRQPGEARRGVVHLICGGGSGVSLLAELRRLGYEVSCGVLNRGDSDWEAARQHGCAIAEELPFTPVGEAAGAVMRDLVGRAGAVVLADLPFGHGNLVNLRAAREAAEAGRPVVVLDVTPVAQRDFTGGEATLEYQRLLRAGAHRVTEVAALAATLALVVRRAEQEEAPRRADEQGGAR